MNALGARVRLVKGAYKEPKGVAYQAQGGRGRRVRRASCRRCCRTDTYPAIATHDPAMIDATRAFAREQRASRRIGSSSRCCTASAATCRRRWSGRVIRVRVYVPFGREWFPYFMRRLGERPANVGFVIREPARRTLST